MKTPPTFFTTFGVSKTTATRAARSRCGVASDTCGIQQSWEHVFPQRHAATFVVSTAVRLAPSRMFRTGLHAGVVRRRCGGARRDRRALQSRFAEHAAVCAAANFWLASHAFWRRDLDARGRTRVCIEAISQLLVAGRRDVCARQRARRVRHV